MNNIPAVRYLVLLLVFAISLVFSVMLITWSREPEVNYRPLVQDLRLVDAVVVVDVLEQYKIDYRIDLKTHLLYVNRRQTDEARIALARTGIGIDYPKFSKHQELQQAFDELKLSLDKQQRAQPIFEQPWFSELIRQALAALVLIVLMLAIVRPALATFIGEKPEE